MNKIMLGAVAALSTAVVFADGIQSANVVGYTSNPTTAGYQGTGLSFVTMNATGKLGDLTITGYTGEYKDAAIFLCKLDNYGRSLEKYYWKDFEAFDDVDDNDNPIVVPAKHGWYTKAGVCVNDDVELSSGEGLWFRSPSADIKVMSSGQVLNAEYAYALTQGYQYLANPTPVQITNIGNIRMSGYTGEYKDAGIRFCKLDNYGRSLTNYYWKDFDAFDDVDDDDQPIVVPGKYGWYDKSGTCVNETETIDVGEAIWFYAKDAGMVINWPTPLVK